MIEETTANEAFIDAAMHLFHSHSGVLRTSEALRLGIHPRTLYTMRDKGCWIASAAASTGSPTCRRWAIPTW